ncbi:hypothetical protein [Streptomyces kanamyceticus]|uniref:hypothetical protein n=1 Tax=Streptomyces kanamyceticus TaxID=1967 RepID=UPI0037DDB60C
MEKVSKAGAEAGRETTELYKILREERHRRAVAQGISCAYRALCLRRPVTGDEFREAALHRQSHEEIAGKADIMRLLHTMECDDEHRLFYLDRIATWSFEDRTGPQFSAGSL